MFNNCTNFNQPLNNWNASDLANMEYMNWRLYKKVSLDKCIFKMKSLIFDHNYSFVMILIQISL